MKYECPCGYIYDPALGDPDSGIAPGTAWENRKIKQEREIPLLFCCYYFYSAMVVSLSHVPVRSRPAMQIRE